MKRTLFTVCSVLVGLSAQAQLSPGSLAFVAFNADSTDGFAVLAMKAIPGNSTIYFTDNEWNELPLGSGGDFMNYNEGELIWTTGPVDLPAGEVITFESLSNESNPGYNVTNGSITGILNLNNIDEVVYVYQGTSETAPTSFITALATTGFNPSRGSLVNTGLVQDSNAIAFRSAPDVGVYNRSTACDSTWSACLKKVNDTLNWQTEDGTSDQSQNGIYPEFPDDIPESFNGVALPLELVHFEINQNPYLHVSYAFAFRSPDCVYEVEWSANGTAWEFMEEVLEQDAGEISLEHLANANLYIRLIKINEDGLSEVLSILSYKSQTPEITLFPNPTSDFIRVSDKSKLLALTLKDIEGNTVKKEHGQVEQMYVGDLRAGVYFAEMKLESSSIQTRLVIAP